MEVICVNDKFSEDFLKFYSKFGIVTPKEGNLYQIRSVIQNSQNGRGLLLIEIVNNKIPISHPILGTNIMMEPNFSIKRFTNLLGETLSVKMLKENLVNI